MKISKKFKLLTATFGIFSVGLAAVASIAALNTSQTTNAKSNDSLTPVSTTTNDFLSTPSAYVAYKGLDVLSNSIGPMLITNNGGTFGAYDWYGNPNWTINLSDYTDAGTTVADWEYLQSKDYLYVITSNSYMFCINATTGEIIANLTQAESGIQSGSNKIASISFDDTLLVWNSNSAMASSSVKSVDRNTLKVTTSTYAATALIGQYLIDILPLQTGYSIAVTSTTIPSSGISGDLTLTFVSDSLNTISGSTSTATVSTATVNITTATDANQLITKAFYRSTTSNYVLIIGDNLLTATLSTSAMENSSITAITGLTPTLSGITSAFQDNDGTLYINSSTNIIYTLNSANTALTTYYTLSNLSSTNNVATDAADSSVTIQIFPVYDSSNSLLSRQVYIATTAGHFTGLSSGSAVNSSYSFETNNVRPRLSVGNSSTFTNQIPSAIDSSYFTSNNTDTLVSSNFTFTVNDVTGLLEVRAIVTLQAWYSSLTTAKTTSYINGDWTLKTAKESTSWASQTTFNSLFSSYTASQLSEENFNAYWDTILIFNSSLTSSATDLTVSFVITDQANASITLYAVVSYYNQYGNFVTFTMDPQEYTTLAASSTYSFTFLGTTTYTEGQTINIANVGGTPATWANYLPSLLDPSTDLVSLIGTCVSYPTSSVRRIISAQADDAAGTLQVTVHFNGIPNDVENDFSITYTGFATYTSSAVSWQGTTIGDLKTAQENITDPSSRDQDLLGDIEDLENAYGTDIADDIIDITTISSYSDYGSLLSTDVTTTQVGLTYSTLLTNMGFVPTLSISRETIDDEYGVIRITLDYTSSSTTVGGETLNFPSSWYNRFGLTNGTITQLYSGFLPIGTTYGVSLKDTSDSSIQSIINDNNVDSTIATSDLLNTLDIRGYDTDGTVSILNYSWNGEQLNFEVKAQSATYSSVNGVYSFTIDWAPKFAAIRDRNLAIAIVVSIIGVAIVAGAIAAYVMRKNKIRRLLK